MILQAKAVDVKDLTHLLPGYVGIQPIQSLQHNPNQTIPGEISFS